MSKDIVEGNFESLPQPPSGIVEGLNTRNVGWIALEHTLATTSTALRARTIGLLTEEPRSVDSLHAEITKNWVNGISRPRRNQIVEIIDTGTTLGSIVQDPYDKTVRLHEGSEMYSAFANNMLGVSLDSNMPLNALVGVHQLAMDWSNIKQLRHLRRLLMYVRIGRANISGISVVSLNRTPVGEPMLRTSLLTETNKMEDSGLVSIVRSFRGNRVYAKSKLKRAADKIETMFEQMQDKPDRFVDDSYERRERIAAAFPYLYKRDIIKSGRGGSTKLQTRHSDIATYLDLCPDGATREELHALFGDSSTKPASFFKSLSVMARMPGFRISARRVGPGGHHRWFSVPKSNGVRPH